MRKPPALPMPRTGGGATTTTSASCIVMNCPNNRRWMAAADWFGSLARWSNGASTRKIAPEFGALVKVAPEKPTMFTAPSTPGVCRARSTARRLTASVRASEAPGGNCTMVMR